MGFLLSAFLSFLFFLVAMPIALRLIRLLGLYAIVEERTCRVYVLFGRVIAVLDEPGLYFLPRRLHGYAFLVHFFGKCHVLDMRLDQEYLRSQPVNSEEGAPMGIGMWYEMYISDPVAYLFKNYEQFHLDRKALIDEIKRKEESREQLAKEIQFLSLEEFRSRELPAILAALQTDENNSVL